MSSVLKGQDISLDIGFGNVPLIVYGALGITSFIIAASSVMQITSNTNDEKSIQPVPETITQQKSETEIEEEIEPEREPLEESQEVSEEETQPNTNNYSKPLSTSETGEQKGGKIQNQNKIKNRKQNKTNKKQKKQKINKNSKTKIKK